jgi:preprotein translocase subunit SecD
MTKNLQWKVILALVVIGGAIILAYPFNDTKIKRGLDLKGGIHLVLQVITDDSINMETDQEIARLEELFKKNGITFQKAIKDGLGRISVQGVLADEEGKTRDLFGQYFRDWDESFTGDRATLALKPLVIQLLRDQAVVQAKETIQNRRRRTPYPETRERQDRRRTARRRQPRPSQGVDQGHGRPRMEAGQGGPRAR